MTQSVCQVETQVEVLQLLIQLIRLRVNYCLLDSDQANQAYGHQISGLCSVPPEI
jgi:hypothetical protein